MSTREAIACALAILGGAVLAHDTWQRLRLPNPPKNPEAQRRHSHMKVIPRATTAGSATAGRGDRS